MDLESKLLINNNKMDPLGSHPMNADEHVGFSRRVINRPSEPKNAGCANLNSQSTGCGAPRSQTKVGGAQQQLKDVNTLVQDDLFWLTDGTPYFHCILGKTHLRQLTMPAKMLRILPGKEVPVVLACGNKSWKMTYYGEHHLSHNRLDRKWKEFVVDNNLKEGDGCVFELLECSEALIKFRVKILSGDFPAELLDRFDGQCSKNPIVLD